MAFDAQPSLSPPSATPSQPQMRSRTLVLCFDGTANQFDGENTNVVRFYSLLKKDDDAEQLCYYQPGVGTYFQPGVVSPLFQWGAKMLDEAVAWYLNAHVQGGYQFLMQNHRPGDKICIFGFSRGAYTARALAGMLHKIGLLPKDNPEQLPFAYKLYKKTDATSLAIAAGFKQTFCRAVQIDFVGVWETVASVGVIMNRTLPFTTTNQTIKVFRHALSLDEHRVKFLPNLYHRSSPNSQSIGIPPSPSSGSGSSSSTSSGSSAEKKSKKKFKEKLARILPRKNKREKAKREAPPKTKEALKEGTQVDISVAAENDLDDGIQGGTDVLEVWFAGCHSDIGGGSVPDGTPHSLANITLRWMVRQVVLAQCGIIFDSGALVRANIPNSIFTGAGFPVTAPTPHPHPNPPQAKPAKGTLAQTKLLPENPAKLVIRADPDPTTIEAGEPSSSPTRPQGEGNSGVHANANPFASPKGKAVELAASEDGLTEISEVIIDPQDVVSPIYDQLKINPLWWLLEIIPLTYSYQDANGVWHKRFGFHFGKGRSIPDVKPNFHTSVQMRMADSSLKYKPRATWAKDSEVWVD